MKRHAGVLALAFALLAGLGVVTALAPGARTLTTLEVEPTAQLPVSGGERLARAVRYSAPFTLGRRSTVRVALEGDHGGVLLSLVDEEEQVREIAVKPGAGVEATRFGAVEAGTHRLRVVAEPPRPPARPGPLWVRVSTGGRPWGLFGLAALLVLVPPLALALRSGRRRRLTGHRRDDAPRNG